MDNNNTSGMKKYFTTDGNKNFGPFTLEELKDQLLTPDTKVWYNGLGDWTPASQIEELKPILDMMPPMPPSSTTGTEETAMPHESVPPTPEQPEQSQPEQDRPVPPMPDTWLVWSILATIFCCQLIGIVGIVYAAQVESEYRQGHYEKAQEYSNNARIWTLVALALGLVVIICYVFLIGIFSLG